MGIPAADQKARIKRTLDLVNLTGFEKKYPWQLSGGMQQRASIARALAFDADLLLMDEPFGALDEIVRDHLNEQLLELWARTNKTICFVTHSIPEAVYLSTRIVVMSPRPGRVTDVIESTLPKERPLDIRETPEFLAIAHRVREACTPATPTRIEAAMDRTSDKVIPVLDAPRRAGRRLVRLRRHPQRAVPARSRPPRRRDARHDRVPRQDAVAAEADRCRRRIRSRSTSSSRPSWCKPWSVRSLVYHAWVTLSSTLLGFAFGTALGILIAVGIVHVATLDRSLMPWIIASQTIPILAIAPMIIVVLAAVGITGLIPKALISTYLSFFPVAVGMVKGLRSPEIINLDLMHTYNASRCADLLEAARAGLGAVPVHLDEGGDRREPGRRHRRRTADRRGRRHRRQAAVRLLLQPDHRHLVGAGRRLGWWRPCWW